MNTAIATAAQAAPAVENDCRAAQQLAALQPLIEIGRLAVEFYFANTRYFGAFRRANIDDDDLFEKLNPLNEQVNAARTSMNNAIGAFIENLD